MKKPRSHVDDLRGVSKLAVEATRGVMGLVEAMQVAIASGPAVLGAPLEKPVKLATGLVYGTMKGITEAVGAGIDAALAQLGPLLGSSAPGPERELVLAALNGVLGDYLEAQGNPLAIPMTLRRDGAPHTLVGATGKLLILVHGSCCTDLMWTSKGHDHGARLASELGYTPLYVHYNSGLHISTNGKKLSALLEEMVRSWPVPLDEIVLLGHSMGGLVARSALHVADEAGHAWRGGVRALVTLGSPHHGAPLERGGNWIDLLLGVSRYSAPFARLARLRSAGITDLRFGNVLDAHWHGKDRFDFGHDDRCPAPLPHGIACYAVAGTLSIADGPDLASDGMVPVASAFGDHATDGLCLSFAPERRYLALGTGHLQLLGSQDVYGKLVEWLRA
ncbi:MAG: alpha/beta hydrolase [Myxococcales bacterium]|nr:alpha/beta hydrolase [Myxococcales bacterium]